MAEFPDLPFFTDAYFADTGDLKGDQHAAYLVMMFTAWTRPDNALPDDMDWLKRILRARISDFHGNKFNSIVPGILARYWYKDEEGKYRQKKLESVRAHKRRLSTIGKENAEKRWGKDGENSEKSPRSVGDRDGKQGSLSLKNNDEGNATALQPSNASTLTHPIPENNKHLPTLKAARADFVDKSRDEGFSKNGFGKGREGVPDPSAAKPIGSVMGMQQFDIRRHLTESVIEDARKAAPGWDVYRLADIYNDGSDKRGIPDKPGLAFVGWCKKYTKGKRP